MVMSRMERMLHERKRDNLDPVLDEYSHHHVFQFSKRFVLIMCVVVFVFVVAMFLPLATDVMNWVRAGFVVASIAAVIAILMDRSTRIHHG